MPSDPKSFRKFKKAPLLFAFIFLAAASLGLYFVYREIRENKNLARVARSEWETEERHRYEIQAMEILLADTMTERAELDKHFARTKNVVPFLDTLQALARKVGAKAEVLSVDVVAESGLSVTLQSEGSFEAIYKFLELLENSPYELEFSTVDIGRTDQGEDVNWEGFFRMKLLSFIP